MTITAVAESWYLLEPEPEIAGSRDRTSDDSVYVPDGDLHGVRAGATLTLCGLPTAEFEPDPQGGSFQPGNNGVCPDCDRALTLP